MLSVSPVGSSCLQPRRAEEQRQAEITFSIPGRIELSATSIFAGLRGYLTGFQYPRSDRVVCNRLT